MPLWQTIAFLLGGVLFLWKGGDWLVDGAVRLGHRFGIPPSLAGVFILGFGTSFPELVVTGLAALDGNSDIAAGNVVGSNIANVGLILGATATLALIPVSSFLLKVEIPVGIAASVLALVLAWDLNISRMDGLILLGAFALYALFAIKTSKNREVPESGEPTSKASFDFALTFLGLAGVLAGGHMFYEGARDVALRLGMPEAVIGQTVVAIGTSLPELATGVAAARANQLSMALGNVIGSNIFNLLLVLGTAGVLADQSVDPIIPHFSMWVMLGLAVFPLVVGMLYRQVGRLAGIFLIIVYGGFLLYNVVRVIQ